MSLKDRILSKSVLQEEAVIDGERFEVRGMSKRTRGNLFAKARKKDGSVDGDRLEALLLCACIYDPESQQPVFTEAEIRQWDDVPSHVTGPLMSCIMRVCGMDKTDLGPKESGTTES